jgi:hypothetical protein
LAFDSLVILLASTPPPTPPPGTPGGAITIPIWQWLVPIIISVIALAQPWIIAFVNYIKPTTLDALESGKIQLLFISVEGPSIGLIGVFKASKSLIVAKTDVEVTKEDGTKMTFEASGFRVRNDNGTERNSYPIAISVKAEVLELYNIVFNNQTMAEEIMRLVAELRQKWAYSVERHLNSVHVPGGRIGPTGTASLRPLFAEERKTESQKFFSSTFMNQTEYQSVLRDLQDQLFWTPGKYTVRFRQYVRGSKLPLQTVWEMRLPANRAADIRSQLPSFIEGLCSAPNTTSIISAVADYTRKLEPQSTK